MLLRSVIAIAVAAAITAPAWAAGTSTAQPDITIYRSQNSALFHAGAGNAVAAGHALVHEQRTLALQAGTHPVTVSDLPDFIDPETIHLVFANDGAQVLSQRLLLPRGDNGSLSGHIGKSVTVLGSSGQQLANGLLQRVNADGSLVIGGDVLGPTLVRHYAAVRLTGGEIGGGARLDVAIDAQHKGNQPVTLNYATGGLGWHAAYTGTLQPGHACRMQLQSMAAIANRSGRSWDNASLKLIAGAPHFAASSSGIQPLAFSRAKMTLAAPAPMPSQASLGDYRSYTLPSAVTLPAGSVTLTPLYRTRTVDCTRTWLFEHGHTYQPTHPALSAGSNGTEIGPVISTLGFTAFANLPAGAMRVLTVDSDHNAEFIGGDRIGDTQRGKPVNVTLGDAFDLTGTRTRTAFTLDQANRQLDESFRIVLTNSGSESRTVTVREHPWRWHVWTLTSASTQPSQKTADTLDFKLKVPAKGQALLTYSVRYNWTAADD